MDFGRLEHMGTMKRTLAFKFIGLITICLTILSMVGIEEVLSQGCGKGNVDIRLDQAGYSAHHLKSRFQYADICYAHAAVDIVDAYRFHVKKDKNFKHLSSPLAAAVAATNGRRPSSEANQNPKAFEYGNICSAVGALFKKGSCSFKEVDRKVYQNITQNAPGGYEIDYDKLKGFFSGLHQRYQKTKLRKVNKEKLQDEIMCYFKDNFYEGAEVEGSKTSFIPDAQIIAKAVEQKHYLDFLQQFIGGLCSNKVTFSNPPSCREYYPKFYKKRNLAKKLHQLLNEGNKALPIGIDFCERVVMTAKKGTESIKSNGDKCIRHATTIIGRREKDNRCQFLLKNTTFCKYIHSKYECEEDSGKVWVDEGDLVESIFGLHYLQ